MPLKCPGPKSEDVDEYVQGVGYREQVLGQRVVDEGVLVFAVAVDGGTRSIAGLGLD